MKTRRWVIPAFVIVILCFVGTLHALPLMAKASSVGHSCPSATRLVSTVSSADNAPVEVLGHIGGAADAIFVEGDYVYAGMGPELAILDSSDPAHPTRVGYVVLPGDIRDIAVLDDQAYVVAGHYPGVLYVVNVASPSLPEVVGSYAVGGYYVTSPINRVAVVGAYAYITWGGCARARICEGGLKVLDISSSTMPVEVGSFDLDYPAQDIAVSGHYAYFVKGATNVWPTDGGLWVVNIADPQSPTEVGHYSTSELISSVTVRGRYAYIALRGSGALRILDILKPASPREVGAYEPGGQAYTAALVGDYAYVSQRIEENDTYWYGLLIVDISNPTAPSLVDSYEGYVADMAVAGIHVYAAKGGAGVGVLDASTPPAPVQIGVYAPPGVGYDLAVSGRYAYLVDGDLRVMDVAAPIDPREVGIYEPDGVAVGVEVAGDSAYVAVGTDGLRVVDVTMPTAPSQIGSYTPPTSTANVVDLAIAGDYACLAAQEGGLRILDISNPTTPVELGVYDVNADRVLAQGTYAYVLSGDYELHIVDISDPNAPVAVAFYELPTGASRNFADLAISENYLYIASGYEIPIVIGSSYWWKALYVADVSDPTAPVWFDPYELPGNYALLGVAAVPDYVYTLHSSSGLCVTRISDPTAPVDLGCYTMPQSWSRRQITPARGNVYVVGDAGLYVLRQHYSVSGQVRTIRGVPQADVTLTTSIGVSTTTAANGVYTFTGLSSGILTLTPTSPGQSFWPPTRTVTLPPDATQQDFVLQQRLLGGRVYDSHGTPFPGVTLTLNTGLTTTTDAQGVYTFTNLAYDAFVLTPTLEGYLFWPPTRTVTLPPDTMDQDFLLRRNTLGGQVTDWHGTPFGEVTLALSIGVSATTDARGMYTFTNLLHGTYLLTPTLTGYTFVPPTRSVTLMPDTTDQDFTILAGPVAISVPVGTAQWPISLVYTDTQGLPTRLVFSAGAITPTTTLRLTPILVGDVPGYAFAGHAFDLQAVYDDQTLSIVFGAPVTLTLYYSDRDVRWVSEETLLALWWWDGAEWWDRPGTLSMPTYTRDLAGNMLRVPLFRTGRHALFGPKRSIYLPLALRNH
jgi:hypothetical protein